MIPEMVSSLDCWWKTEINLGEEIRPFVRIGYSVPCESKPTAGKLINFHKELGLDDLTKS